MENFQDMILSKGDENITVKRIVKGITPRGFSITESGYKIMPKRGIQMFSEERIFSTSEGKDVDEFVEKKLKEGFKITKML